MTTRLETDDEVGERLRRTFAARAGDLAEGDPPRLVPAPEAGVRPAPTGDAAPVARHRRRALAVAASLLVVGGLAAAVVAREAGTAGDPDAGGSRADAVADSAATTAPATTTTLGPGGAYTVGAFESGPDRWVTVSFDDSMGGSGVDVPGILGSQFQPVQAGPNSGYVVESPGVAVWLLFDDGMVRLESGGMAAEDVIAIAATVEKDASTGRYTVPTPVGWAVIPEMLDPGDGAALGAPASGPVGVGSFVAAGGASYSGIWYRGWTRDSLPDGAEQVDVAAGPAYVGSIAPTAEGMLQLWVVFEDGVVELQSVAMSREDLVAAGNGVQRTEGTDQFTLTPPPGYTPQ